MKKHVIAATITAVSLIGAADASTGLGGWYLGAQAGIQDTTAHHFNTSGNVTSGGVSLPISNSFNGGKVGGTIGAMGGYGHLCHKWFFAGQLEGSGGNYHIHSRASLAGLTSRNHLKTSAVWGIAALFGYEIVPSTVGYIRLGGDIANWKLSNSGLINASKSKSSLGFAPGIGVRAHIAKNWFVNAEYKHSFFQKINLVGGGNTVSATPRLQTFTVGFAFKL